MVSAIFDDHYEAFPVWREAKLTGLTVIHVDAHLDVMRDGFSPQTLKGIAEAKTAQELGQFRGNPRLPRGGFHCGNYLFPGLVDGTIETLIWVVPPHVIKGETFVDGVRQETQSWLDLTFEEYGSLKSDSAGAVVGVLEGRTYVVCTADKLPELTEQQKQNLALDIDVDYYIRNTDDKVWQTPHELAHLLGDIQPKALTIAYSVDGGYTPLKDRYLGEVTQAVFGSGTELYEAETKSLIAADEMEPEQRATAWEELLQTAPDFMRAPLLYRLNRKDEAAEENEGYRERYLNLVSRHFIKKETEQGLALLEASEEKSEESLYLSAYLHIQRGEHRQTKEALLLLLNSGDIIDLERSRLLLSLAGACLELGEPKEALTHLDEALALEPYLSEVQYLRASCQKLLGDGKVAAKTLRKALRMCKGRVSSLHMMLEAAKIYDELGQAALARSTRRELKLSDVTGRYAIQTMLDASRL